MAKKILIVDDEPDMLEILRFRLEKSGYKIVTAGSAEEGLKKAVTSKPDLILLDILLPGISGLEAARRLKKNRLTKNIPIIMVTALIGKEVMLEGMRDGAEYLISKPFDPAELLAEIKVVVDKGAAKSTKKPR